MKNADQDVIETSIAWLEAGHQVDLVTVVNTWGSSPRPPGSLAAVREDGVLVGSVSGGCVEKQLAESFRGKPLSSVHSYHIDDQQARRFGLACGGELELVFEALNNAEPLKAVLTSLHNRQRVIRTTTIGTENSSIDKATPNDAFSYDGTTVKKVFGPDWQVLLIGAGQLSHYVAQFALATDFTVMVCDPRPEFQQAWDVSGTTLLTVEPHDAVLENAIDFNTAVLALTHDPNLDDMALLEALPQSCFYVGALGSKRNYERRCKRLANLLEPEHIQKLHSPIGIAIGSRTSAEIAISIVAQLVEKRSMASKTRQQKPTV